MSGGLGPDEAWAELTEADLRARFGPPTPELLEDLKEQLDRLAHRSPLRALHGARALVAYADGSCDPACRVIARLAFANVLLWADEVQAAGAAYDEAQLLAEAIGDEALAARCGIGKMGALLRLGRAKEALAVARRIEPVLRAKGHKLLLARATGQRATALRYLGETEAAAEAYAQAAELLRGIPEASLDLATVLHNLGLLLTRMGHSAEARAALQEAQEAARRARSALWEARVVAALAELDVIAGRYTRAFGAYERAAELYERAGVAATGAVYRLRALECWLYLGRFDRAFEEGRRLADALAARGFAAEAARARYFAALARRASGGWEEAEELLRRAVFELAAAQRYDWWAAALIELAALRVRRKALGEAGGLLEQAKALVVREPVLLARARLVESDLHLARQDMPSAARAAQQALRIGRTHRIPWLCALAHRRLAQASPRTLRHLLCGVGYAERLLGGLGADLRWSTYREFQGLFAEALRALCRAGRWEQAWEMSQRMKARGMAELVTHPPVQAATPEDEPLVAELRRLRDQHRALVQDGEKWEVLHDLEHRIQELQDRLWARSARYRDDAALVGFGRSVERPALDGKTALVEYVVDPYGLVAFVLTDEETAVFPNLASPQDLARLAGLFRLGLRSYAAGRVGPQAGLRQIHRVLEDLHALLLKPLEPALDRRPRLVIAPSGPLYGLPFHAFLDGGEPVWEKREVAYIPAGSLLPLLRRRRRSPGPAVLFADTNQGLIPHAEEEAEAVARLVGGSLVRSPNRETFVRRLRKAGMVHVAAHCVFRPESPLLSHISLADGPLYALDLLEVRCDAELVVLSGCSTGAAAVLPGDELVGFVRAWFRAGARTLVLSLWPVPDASTRLFMEAFYHEVKRGRCIPEALRAAALAVRATHPHPLHWAGFVTVGDPDLRFAPR